MATPQHWSFALAPVQPRAKARPRWLDQHGRFTCDPAKALRVIHLEAAANRLHTFLAARGRPTKTLERLQVVPSP